ncbi:MAG: ANTAR domain-containing protein [Acidimicrobiia bacterium]|nr:ANTAR domain-containing protein [Acidimicrobiia bacterium]
MDLAAGSLIASGADMATARIVDAVNDRLLLVAAPGFDVSFVDRCGVIPYRSTTYGRELARGAPVVVRDARFSPLIDGTELQAGLLDTGSFAFVAFPIRAAGVVDAVVWAHYRRPGVHECLEGVAIATRVEQILAQPFTARLDSDEVLLLENAHLRRALAGRDRIGMAKGLLMGQSDLDESAAFRILSRASQRENVKLRQLCDRLIETHTARLAAAALR